MLNGKKIVLGVTGGIAAYKSASIIRLLVKEGAEVKVIMTPNAKNFITPLTLATLSKNPILVEFFNPENGDWNSHVSIGEWADAYLIAPATAASIAKMATGVADNLLVTTYLSAKCPVFLAPTMDLDMYKHPSTERNINTLRSFGNHIIEPGDGELASGLVGKGRMAEPEQIVDALRLFFFTEQTLTGKKILVTAGATVERIDPVRYISNDSTGKMGCEIVRELVKRGADVCLVAGKMSVSCSEIGARVIHVESAEQMYNTCSDMFSECDAAIFSAAVADYTPKTVATEKIKKSDCDLSIEMVPTHDIAAELSARKGTKITVGFALESNNETENALSKLKRKSLNFIVLNSLRDSGAGFGYDTNKVTILSDDDGCQEFPLKNKAEVAADIADHLEKYFKKC